MYKMLSAWTTFLVFYYTCSYISGRGSDIEASERYFEMTASTYLELSAEVGFKFVFQYMASQKNTYLVKIMLQQEKF